MGCLFVNTAMSGTQLAWQDTIDAQCHTVFYEDMRAQANMLVTYVEALLQQQERSYKDISHLCVNSGPGSFTGIRIGLAFARTFLLVQPDTHVFALNGFQLYALSKQDKNKDILCVSIDSFRKDGIFAAFIKYPMHHAKPSPSHILEEGFFSLPVFQERIFAYEQIYGQLEYSGNQVDKIHENFQNKYPVSRDICTYCLSVEADGNGQLIPYYINEADISLSKKKFRRIIE